MTYFISLCLWCLSCIYTASFRHIKPASAYQRIAGRKIVSALAMEVWLLESASDHAPTEALLEGVDKSLGNDWYKQGGKLFDKAGDLRGAHVVITGERSQSDARALLGSVEWLLVEFTSDSWSLIPLENLIAACAPPTRIAAVIRTEEEAQGAGFALETGVDALVASPQLLEAALVVKCLRGENVNESVVEEAGAAPIGLLPLLITDVQDGGVGDRYCVDLTSLLKKGEGLLIGSTASSMALVHGETIESVFVPTRPFRINAGSPECYCRLAGDKTKYLCELKSNDKVMVQAADGGQREATIGRVKIERRPFVRVGWRGGHMFLQQAETVRLLRPDGEPVSVTSLKAGDSILGYVDMAGRHTGIAVKSSVEER